MPSTARKIDSFPESNAYIVTKENEENVNNSQENKIIIKNMHEEPEFLEDDKINEILSTMTMG